MGTVNLWEGIALEVLAAEKYWALAKGGLEQIIGQWYHWLERDLLCSDGRIYLMPDGKAVVPWGTGSWRQDLTAAALQADDYVHILLDWQGSESQSPQNWIP